MPSKQAEKAPAVFDQDRLTSPVVFEGRTIGGGISYNEFMQALSGAVEVPEESVDAFTIAASIASADSLDALGESNAEGLRDHLGEYFLIHDFRLRTSDEKFKGQGAPVFAAIDATLEKTGERMVLTTGAYKVLGALGLMLRTGKGWDDRFIAKGIDGKRGQIISLVYSPKPAGFTEADES